ncbi:MAG: hypothetical protein JO048_09845 [Methylobacteriaceae bacterium]|nr:hypothetical protein [Methylobacteriaceae bacterium]
MRDAGARWRGFVRDAALAASLALAAGVSAILATDPLWIWQERPPWLAWTGGVNRLLDAEMRRAKPLQLFGRPAGTLLVGSSVVYRGLDPALVRDGAYNLGLSSLMADELPDVARLAAARGAQTVLIGLDYFMFSAFPGPPRLPTGLEAPASRLAASLHVALSLRTLAGAAPFVLARAYEGGAWQADGFKTTPDYGSAATLAIAADQRFGDMAYRPATLAHLRAALAILAGRDVRLYLSPMSRPQRRLADTAGRGPELADWRADVAAVAREAGVALLDLVDAPGLDDFDPARGSSAFWFDNLHFKPAVGRMVLARLGIATRDR